MYINFSITSQTRKNVNVYDMTAINCCMLRQINAPDEQVEEVLNNYECGMLDRRLFHKLIISVYPVIGQLWSKYAYTAVRRFVCVCVCIELMRFGVPCLRLYCTPCRLS